MSGNDGNVFWGGNVSETVILVINSQPKGPMYEHSMLRNLEKVESIHVAMIQSACSGSTIPTEQEPRLGPSQLEDVVLYSIVKFLRLEKGLRYNG
jgi:hypothetical protein